MVNNSFVSSHCLETVRQQSGYSNAVQFIIDAMLLLFC